MSPCVPTIETSRPGGCHQPAMAFSPPFLPRPDFPLPGMLQVLKKKSYFSFSSVFRNRNHCGKARSHRQPKVVFPKYLHPVHLFPRNSPCIGKFGLHDLFFFHPRHGGFPRQFEMVISSRNPGLVALVDAWLSWPGPHQLLRHPLW